MRRDDADPEFDTTLTGGIRFLNKNLCRIEDLCPVTLSRLSEKFQETAEGFLNLLVYLPLGDPPGDEGPEHEVARTGRIF